MQMVRPSEAWRLPKFSNSLAVQKISSLRKIGGVTQYQTMELYLELRVLHEVRENLRADYKPIKRLSSLLEHSLRGGNQDDFVTNACRAV